MLVSDYRIHTAALEVLLSGTLREFLGRWQKRKKKKIQRKKFHKFAYKLEPNF